MSTPRRPLIAGNWKMNGLRADGGSLASDLTDLMKNETGAVFDNPVLDTVLLSVHLHDHLAEHTLDAIANRFGVVFEGRHTALGDAMATAEIFLHLVELCRERGIVTLGQALKASETVRSIRRKQARF